MDKECFKCDCYDSDFGCTMPSMDKWYACPIQSALPENIAKLEEYINATNIDAKEIGVIKR